MLSAAKQDTGEVNIGEHQAFRLIALAKGFGLVQHVGDGFSGSAKELQFLLDVRQIARQPVRPIDGGSGGESAKPQKHREDRQDPYRWGGGKTSFPDGGECLVAWNSF